MTLVTNSKQHGDLKPIANHPKKWQFEENQNQDSTSNTTEERPSECKSGKPVEHSGLARVSAKGSHEPKDNPLATCDVSMESSISDNSSKAVGDLQHQPTTIPKPTTKMSYRDSAASKAKEELRRQTLTCLQASDIINGQIKTRIYVMKKVPPYWIQNTLETKFKSLHAFQVNLLQSTSSDQIIKPSITLAFSKSKNPSTWIDDCENSLSFTLGDNDNSISFLAMSGTNEKEFTPLENIVKSAFLYRTSIYFTQHPDRIKEAFKDYFELDLERTVITTRAGIFDGSIRLSVKKFKKIPPKLFCVPEYDGEGRLVPNRKRQLMVKCFGYDATRQQPETIIEITPKCDTCAWRFDSNNHRTSLCPYQKSCSICQGRGCLKNTCRHMDSINKGNWAPAKADIEKARKLRNREKFKTNRNNSRENHVIPRNFRKRGERSPVKKRTNIPSPSPEKEPLVSNLESNPPQPQKPSSTVSQTTSKLENLKLNDDLNESQETVISTGTSPSAMSNSNDTIKQKTGTFKTEDPKVTDPAAMGKPSISGKVISSEQEVVQAPDTSQGLNHANTDAAAMGNPSISAEASPPKGQTKPTLDNLNIPQGEDLKHSYAAAMGNPPISAAGATRVQINPVRFSYFSDLSTQSQRIQADGNCLYRCFAKFIYGKQSTHMSVRKSIWGHILKERQTYEPDYNLAIEDSTPERRFVGSYREWVDHHKTDSIYGDSTAIKAFSRIRFENKKHPLKLIKLKVTSNLDSTSFSWAASNGTAVNEKTDLSHLKKSEILELELKGCHYELTNFEDSPANPVNITTHIDTLRNPDEKCSLDKAYERITGNKTSRVETPSENRRRSLRLTSGDVVSTNTTNLN